jgi:aspartate/methionine/tyrosine aminotransferase
MSDISPRIAAIAPSATLAITSKAKALRAEGKPVIGFGAGEPDFPTPDHVVEAAAAAVRDPRNHKYSPAAGLPELRAAVAARMSDGGVPTEAADVLITNGGKQAVYSAFATLMGPGDEVLLPAPYWVSYPEAIHLAGATPVIVSTGIDAGFKVTPDLLESHRTEATKALIFVSPSNPTGAVYSADEVRAIGAWAAEHGVWVLTDEIYDHLVYGDATFTSMPAVVPEVRDRCVVLNGVAKTYAMTGWRVGWMAVEAMHEAFDRRRRTMHRMLNEIPGVECLEPQGAFYAFPSFAGAAGERSTLDLAAEILEESLVALVPGEAFGAPGYMRLSYALGDEDLEEGLRRLAAHLA